MFNDFFQYQAYLASEWNIGYPVYVQIYVRANFGFNENEFKMRTVHVLP
jgi:hypothetical protein